MAIMVEIFHEKKNPSQPDFEFTLLEFNVKPMYFSENLEHVLGSLQGANLTL